MDLQLFIGEGNFFFARTRTRILSSALLVLLTAFISTTVLADEKTFADSLSKISNANLGVSLQAVDYLGRSHDRRAVLGLSAAYSHEKRMVVQRAIVDALGLLRSSDAAPVLLQALNNPEPQVRQSAVIALELVGGADNQQAIIDHAAKENDIAVKSHMVQILGRSKHPKSLAALKAFAKDKNSQISRMAQHELDKKAVSK
jgi:HEAT repeat protein